MLLTYIDESYDQTNYWIAALVVPEQHVRSLAQALDAVVQKAAASYPVSRDAELHGHAIVQAVDDWAAMANSQGNMIRARIGVYGDALRAIADHEVAIIVRGVDIQQLKTRYTNPYPPHQVVLSQLLERVQDYAEARDALALVIADEIAEADQHRAAFRDYQEVGTGGYLSSTLPRLVDTIHFAPSKSSRLLQAVDLVAYLHRRLTSRQDTDPRARKANVKLWSYVEPRVTHSHCWEPMAYYGMWV
ncbi:DUF3800 domain-containing protein [Streptomyces sp. NPDC056468]|uniref:DUF3800 domain-containing protein n=1 Tax=Streptomyces sp. NPDC056468 TaxID=3345830 RepID=UPI0036B69608